MAPPESANHTVLPECPACGARLSADDNGRCSFCHTNLITAIPHAAQIASGIPTSTAKREGYSRWWNALPIAILVGLAALWMLIAPHVDPYRPENRPTTTAAPAPPANK